MRLLLWVATVLPGAICCLSMLLKSARARSLLGKAPRSLLSLCQGMASTRYQLATGDVLTSEEADRAKRCMEFLDASPDPFHCVQSVTKALDAARFQCLDEGDLWSKEKLLRPGGKYYFTRQGSSIVAFAVGAKYEPGAGFKILGAHSDSPNLRIKPKSRRGLASGMVQLSVEPYGGGLWHTWFDRDLSLSGRVLLRTDDGFVAKTVKIDRPILRIPSLCIHLRSQEERDAFRVDKVDDLVPVLCSETARALDEFDADAWATGHEPTLLALLAQQLQCDGRAIADFDLSLFDTQPAARTGLLGDLLCSARLDNLASCFVLTDALIQHSQDLSADGEVSMVALFDHEEVGSESAVGAGSAFLQETLPRIMGALSADGDALEAIAAAKARSLIVSVDMTHAVHPNYASRHDRQHAPVMNGGVVIKSNANQRYATSSATAFLVRELARRHTLPVQEFAVRNDCPCGSTIGPTLSTNTGIRAVDVGMPLLSMHSVRETMGCKDLTSAVRLLRGFLQDFTALDRQVKL